MTAKQQKTITIGVVVGLVLAFGAYFLVIGPQLTKRAEDRAAITDADAQAVALVGQLATLEAKRDAMPDAQAQVAALTEKFPNSYQQDQWLQMIMTTAKDSGVALSSIAPTEPSSPGADPLAPAPAAGTAPVADAAFPIAQSSVALSASGSSAAVARFIKALENMTRPLLIDSIEYTGATSGQGASISLTGKTFLSRPLEAPVPAAAPDPATGQ